MPLWLTVILCATGAVAFFVGQPIHAARMLAGIVQVSVGLWALITCMDFSRSVLALGLGVRWRPPDVALRTRQLRFRNKLLADLEGEA